ncbi:MAG: DUF4493 domain-containing protein [Bacteroidales bacterium]|nr:DUF4493 domain-containing protein [Bacteroidales bacterium]
MNAKSFIVSRIRAFCLVVSLLSFFSSCGSLGLDKDEDADTGVLRISFASDLDSEVRSAFELPDTSDFILTVKSSDGIVIYNGNYGDSPEAISVPSGGYLVSAVSCRFEKPAFDSPQFGDEQYVEVPAGGVISVKLVCSQMNSGVRLKIDTDFLDVYPDGVLFLSSSKGKLMYGYTEKRIAYFMPGSISLLFSNAGKDEVLLTKNLAPQQMLTITVDVAADAGGQSDKSGRVSVAVDTTREWIDESLVIGGESQEGSDADDAMTVYQAIGAAGQNDVWVSGYIVGGDLTASSASYHIPFSSRTCLLLGSRSVITDRNTCIAVQLPSGNVRDNLNLVDNQWLLGRKVCLKGNIVESYYGLTGLKAVTEYEIN